MVLSTVIIKLPLGYLKMIPYMTDLNTLDFDTTLFATKLKRTASVWCGFLQENSKLIY